MTTDVVLQTEGLTKDYGGGQGCFDISLSISRGQIFGFLGPNGAGKSTFVKMLVGLVRPTAGSAWLLGQSIGDRSARRHIGYLPELFRYQEWLTGREVLHFHAGLSGISRHERPKRIGDVLEQVGLLGRELEYVRTYSKGMQQRLGLACALLSHPQVVFLDEPASALDPAGRHHIRAILSDLRNSGTTVFLNTHLLEDVEALCDEVALLHGGRIQAMGRVEDILSADSTWTFHVGGWDEVGHLELQEHSGRELEVVQVRDDGFAILHAQAHTQEDVGRITHSIFVTGMTLYEASCVPHRLEEWFLQLTVPSNE